MGRSVIAEDNLLPYLTQLAKQDSYVIGLVLGQATEKNDFVVHLARTPKPASEDVKEESGGMSSPAASRMEHIKLLKSLQDVQESWVADHAKHVTRMLPGGMWVLGIFVVGPGDVFADAKSVNRLKTVLLHIKKALSSNPYLHGVSPCAEQVVLHLSSTTQKYSCRSFEVNSISGALHPVEWKFQSKSSNWQQLDCQYDLDQMFPISADRQTQSLRKHAQDILASVSNTIISAVCMIDGELRDPSDTLDSLGKKKKSKGSSKSMGASEAKVLNASLYVPCDHICRWLMGPLDLARRIVNRSIDHILSSPLRGRLYMPWQDSEMKTDLEILDCCGELNFNGNVASRVFLHQKATVEEAVQAVKQDIIRSLASRLEMHLDSLIEEEQGSPEERLTLHEPPRRVLVPLPHSRVTLSDYLFPGEGPSEALISLQELLDVEVEEHDVQKDVEVQADAADFYTMEAPHESDSSEDLLPGRVSSQNVLFSGLLVAMAILIISVAVQFSGWTTNKTE